MIIKILFLISVTYSMLVAGFLVNSSDSTSPSVLYRDTVINNVRYFDVSVLKLSENFETMKWFPLKEKMALKSKELYIQLTNESSFLLVGDDSLLVLDDVPLYVNDHFWIPSSILDVLNPIISNQLSMINDSVLTFQKSTGLIGLAVKQKSNGTLVELEFSKSYSFDKWFHKPHYILRFEGLEIEPAQWKRTFKSGLVKKILPVRENNLSQLTFEVTPGTDDVELISSENSKKMQLLFRERKKVSTKTNDTPPPAKRIKNIIIDAGHGGKDPGARGLRYNEKDITLKVAKELKKILLKHGFNPILTREKDEYLTLQQRPQFATEKEGDMFISLHCNAIPGSVRKKKSTRGFKIYILREATSEDDKAIARRENEAIAEVSDNKSKQEITPVEWILLEHQLNLFTKESELLAGHLVENMSDNLKGVKKMGYGAGQAGFYVLVGAFMPAVLVEMGFISNPKEEIYMNSKKGSREIAHSIFTSIMSYKKEVEGN